MPDKKSENPPIVITFTINPAMKTNTQGQRCMAVSVVARQGDAGQVSRFDMTNWKVDLPTEVDRLMRLLLGGLALPDFPDMNQPAAAPEATQPDGEPEAVEAEAASDLEEVEDVEPEPEASVEDEGEYDIALYPAAGEAGEDASPQPGLF